MNFFFERFGMKDSKHVTTPLAAHFKLSSALSPKSKDKEEKMSRVPYAMAVGSMIYAMDYTRPDISQAISVVSRFMGSLGKNH